MAKVIDADAGSYVDWSAIIAGIVFASAISIVMLAFGSAIGLTFASVSSKGTAIAAGIGAALWFLWVEVSGFMAGAYLTGRLRKPYQEGTAHEIEVRDGSHGLLVWGGGIVVGAILALSGASSLVNTASSFAKTATETVANAGANASVFQYYTDTMLRVPAQANAPAPKADHTIASGEINTIFARTAMATPTDDDKAYLAQLVSDQTGLSAQDAKVRVDQAYTSIDKAKADAAQAAETARRVSVLAAFLLAASMLVSAAAAFWAATEGGRHRMEGAVFQGFFRRV